MSNPGFGFLYGDMFEGVAADDTGEGFRRSVVSLASHPMHS